MISSHRLTEHEKSMIRVGFEVEFCHHWSNQKIKKELPEFLDIKPKWISNKDRYRPCNKNLSKKCFTICVEGTVDPDYGDQNPHEIITPVREYNAGKRELFDILNWIELTGGTTNRTCSLHVNLSLHGLLKTKDIDRSKLIVLTDEEYWLKKFKRSGNRWAKPHTDYIRKRYQRKQPKTLQECWSVFADINSRHHDRAISFIRDHYVEFRMIGNKDYHLKTDTVSHAIDSFAQNCLDACIPRTYDNQLKKLISTY